MDTSDLAEFKSIMEQGAERYRADQARIAALETQLAEEKEHSAMYARRLIAATDRAEEAERLAVFAALRHCQYYADRPVGHLMYWGDPGRNKSEEIECDGTPAGILAALAKAAGEE